MKSTHVWKHDLLPVLPGRLSGILRALDEELCVRLEEIRIRVNQPLCIGTGGANHFLNAAGRICAYRDAYRVSQAEAKELLLRLSQSSIYAYEEELRRGYITIKGGYRVGIAGKAVLQGGAVRLVHPCTSFNIRISREVIGAADKVMPYILEDGYPLHTLIVSPPQAGKTTLLRDIARQLSEGAGSFGCLKVVVIDERSEIAGCHNGVPQNRIGYMSDVLDGCPKAEGMMMALRGLSPQVIITDEIGREEDIDAIMEALHGGVCVIASVHAREYEELKSRPIMNRMLKNRVFERYILLSARDGAGTLESVADKDFHMLHKTKETG
ncbi:MAG: stage III sporulation protein AA [Christensenellales bacterium]|jgi:stage III sporulation protein AA